MARLQFSILKLVTAILAGIVLLGVIGFAILYFGTQLYLDKNLSDLVRKKSKGKYELTYGDLEFNYRHWGVEIKQVSYHPSDSVINALNMSKNERPFYSFSSPQISIYRLNIRKLIFNKKLTVGELIVEQPELKIHGHQPDSEKQGEEIQALVGELKPLVTKTFKSISIGKIELRNASYDLYRLAGDTKKLSNAENISIGILDFYTDSLLLPNPERIFNASDVYIRMQKYQNRLADSIHAISAASITYSLKKSVIEAQNIELKPIGRANQRKSRYYFFIPQTRITTSSLAEFYKNNVIPIDSLVLKNAQLKYWPREKADGNPNPYDEFDLNDLIKDEISGVTIRNFLLKNAQLKLYKDQADTINQQELKKIDLSLSDFKLDSGAQNDTSRIFYSKNIDLSVSDYELTLGDNLHHVKAGRLQLSTIGKSVLVNDIRVFPKDGTATVLANTIDASCDSVRLSDFDFKRAYHQKRFLFQRINLFNPEVQLNQNMQGSKKNGDVDSSFVYELISQYVKGVYARQVLVSKGKLQLLNKTGVLQTGKIESAVRLQLLGFALDEASVRRTDRLFYADQIELNFDNYEMQLADQLHKLAVENLTISTRNKMAKLRNLHLTHLTSENLEEILKKYNRSEVYEFTIPELILSNADFHRAFFNKELSIDSLRISSPQIYYERYASLQQAQPKQDFDDLFRLISDYLTDIGVKTLDIPEGTIRLINHNKKDKTLSFNNRFSLKLGNMRINEGSFGQKKLLFSDFVDFSVRDHLIRLSDNVHVLKAGEIGFSTQRKEIYAVNARLYPETGSKDYPNVKWNIQLTVPELRIKGIDIEQFIFDHQITADNLLIKSPDIKLYQKQKPSVKKEIKDVAIPLPKEIESIDIQNFNLSDGSLKVFSEIETKPVLLVQSDLRIGAKSISIRKSSANSIMELKEGIYSGQLNQFRYTPKDKNQQYSIEEVSFSTADRQIVAKNLLAKPKTKSSAQNQYELLIPHLSLSGLNFDDAFKNNIYKFETIVLERPVFQRFVNAKDSAKINPYKLNLYPYFEGFADVFYSRNLKVNQASITVFQSGQRKFQETISLNLEQMLINDKPTQGFLHSTGFSFTIPGIKRQSKNYRFEADKMSYSSTASKLTTSGIRIIPLYNKSEFQRKTGVQSDYFSGKIDSISVSGIDVKRWFDKEEISGKLMNIQGLDLDVYRDKRTPFDQARRTKGIQEMIKSIKRPFSFDSLALTRSKVSYSEMSETTGQEGRIRFSNIRLGVGHVSNLKAGNGRYPDFNIDGMAVIQDSCELKTRLNYKMNDSSNPFKVKGNISPFNIRILNPIVEPLALVSVRSGKVNRFEFDFSADQNSSSGQLYFGYDDLKISVLELKDGNTREARFASFLANSLLVRGKNPRGKEFLPDEIAFIRDTKRSELNYWWKSVFSGVKNTLGIKDKQEGTSE